MPSDRALRLAEIFDAAMDQAGFSLVDRAGNPVHGAGAPAPTQALPVGPGAAGVPAVPAAQAPASPTVTTVWSWDGSINAATPGTIYASGPVQPSAAVGGALLCPLAPGQQRCVAETPVYFNEGDDVWTVFDLALLSGFPVDFASWQLFAEFKNDSIGTAPIELGVGKNQYTLSGGMGHPAGNKNTEAAFGAPLADGNWHQFQIHTKFSSNPDVGFVDIYVDNQPHILSWRSRGATLYPGARSYLRFGQNTSPHPAQTALALRGMKVGRVGQ